MTWVEFGISVTQNLTSYIEYLEEINVKRIIETKNDGGFDAMLGEKIVLMCGVYIYTGMLVGVNEDHLELKDPLLVYETGAWNEEVWGDAQPLLSPWRVMIQSIESWGAAKC